MENIQILEIINSDLDCDTKLHVIQMLEWRKLAEKSIHSVETKIKFDNFVQKTIRKLNPIIFYANTEDQIAKITKQYLVRYKNQNKNVLIVVSDDNLKTYFPIFLHR